MPVQSRHSVQARKTGTSLFAAYRNASPPLIWKFDLEKNHSFTLTLQGEEGDWELGVTSPKGEFYSVARFLARDDADEAFAQTQKALMASQHDGLWGIWGRISAVLFCILIVLSLVSAFSHRNSSRMPPLNVPMSGGNMEMPMEMREGVPMPADQVLHAPP